MKSTPERSDLARLQKLIKGPKIGPELSRLVTASSLLKGETRFEIETSDKERARIAKRLDLVTLNSLSASLRLIVSNDGGAVDVEGEFTAETVQQCAVTLEPLVCEVIGALSIRYAFNAEADLLAPINTKDDAEEDPPEPIIDGVFELGESLTQALSLEIEAYPRSPGLPYDVYVSGEGLSGAATDTITGKAGPFAGLAALKNKLT